MRAIRLLPLILIACGDNNDTDHKPDAHVADAAVDAPTPVPCSYNEMSDATNDDFFGNGTAEATGLTFTGTSIGICGKLDVGHYEQARMLIDVDVYHINVPAASNGILYVTAPGAEALNTVLIEIYSLSSSEDSVGKFIGNFAMASISLPAGDYAVQISAFHGSAATAAIDYKLVLQLDNPTARCGKVADTATYTEMLDGLTDDGNDVYEVRYSGSPKRDFTANPADMVEPTGIMVAPGMRYRVSGTSDKPTVTPPDWMDAYQDRDTYQITMGANTNQLSLRLNWASTTADMDFLVFPMAQLSDFADGFKNALVEDEFETFAVTPGMSYWVFVGADDTTTGQPVPYDLSICGATFTAP